MKRVLTAVILIPIVVLALFRAPLWLFALLVLGVALLAAKEYFMIAEANGVRPFPKLSYLFLICIFLLAYTGGLAMRDPRHLFQSVTMQAVISVAFLLVLTSPFTLLVAGMRREPLAHSLPDAASSFLLLPYVGCSLASMVIVRGGKNSALFLLFLMLLVWSGDIAAYYVGRAIGKHKLAPRISPAKTWEGAIASVVGAALVGVLLFHSLDAIYNFFARIHLVSAIQGSVFGLNQPPKFAPVPISLAILFAICVNVSAQLGDLVESMLKRGGGVKDSGTLLPGHGGVLDRIDALLFAAPVGWIFYFVIFGRYFQPTVLG